MMLNFRSCLLVSLFLLLAEGMVSVCHAVDPEADYYVATDGSDDWSGTLPAPNAQGTDGPFATLERARDALRAFLKPHAGNKNILIRGGRYEVSQTIVFDRRDAGHGFAKITYAAYPGETPVFRMSRQISNWKPVDQNVARLSQKAREKVQVADVTGRFHALFDEDGLLPRARSEGFIPRKGGGRNEVHVPSGLLHDWPNIEDIEVVVRPHHAWIVNILPLRSVDLEKRVASTSVDATYAMNELHFLKTTPSCWIENAMEELDEPGEWVLDSQQGKLYLWPRTDSPVWAPQGTELIRVEGKIDKEGPRDRPVLNLHFQGLTFMHGDRYTVSNDDAGLQHDWDMHDKANALIRFRGTEQCSINQCRFAHTGGSAIRVDLHGQANTIAGNVIEHIGGAGILLCGYGPGSKDVNRNNFVSNNHIHHIGQIYFHSPGIMVWQSGENRIANNLVHHTPYTGIIVSGCMADFFRRKGRELTRTIRWHEVGELAGPPQRQNLLPYLHTRNNKIENNEIHHAMEMLGDGNAIYVRGAGVGNEIRDNYIHHLVAPMIMQAAIRTDGGQTDTLIAGNLVYKCTSQGIILKLNNRCENNIIADIIAPPRGYYLAVREGPMKGATIKRNIFYSSSDNCEFNNELPPGNGRVSEDRRGRKLAMVKQADTNHNIYYCDSNPDLGSQTLARNQANGIDGESLAVDPQFVDAANGDFRLRDTSPARRLGIVPFDVSKAGLIPAP